MLRDQKRAAGSDWVRSLPHLVLSLAASDSGPVVGWAALVSFSVAIPVLRIVQRCSS